MKSRLAKKIAHTRLDRLAPSWIKRFRNSDARIEMALKKWNKRKEQRP